MEEDIQMQVAEPIQTVVQKLESWLDTFISMLPNMAVALLLLIIFFVLAKLGSNSTPVRSILIFDFGSNTPENPAT